MSSGVDQRVLPRALQGHPSFPGTTHQARCVISCVGHADDESVQVLTRDMRVDTGVGAVPASLTQGLPYPFYTPLDL